MNEAFVYLWYTRKTDKYYLGYHLGSPEDDYTHSSTIWESFTKDTIPKGARRRILAYGTPDEMVELEHKLLVNRKFKAHNNKWDKYYNIAVGSSFYIDVSGKNNPMYGIPHTPETKKKIGDGLARKYIITYPDGKEELITNLNKFCRENGLHKGNLTEVAQGKRKQHKGYKVRYA
jgi:hypothetical protein